MFAPITSPTLFPALYATNAGTYADQRPPAEGVNEERRTLSAPASVATSFAASMSTLKNARRGCCVENWSNAGSTSLHAPAHVAQKLTTAVRSLLICDRSDGYVRRNARDQSAYRRMELVQALDHRHAHRGGGREECKA
jgi:hypothetical protein